MTQLAAVILALNAQADPQTGAHWIHLLPSGSFTGRDGRGPWHVADPRQVIDASRRRAGKTLIPIDYEHQIDHAPANGKPAPAAGWIKGMQARADGIWALVDWTPKAAAHLAAKEYRYLSPVLAFAPGGRVTHIPRASLVQSPNLDQLTALASTQETLMTPSSSPEPDDGLADIRQLLKLPDDADIAAIAAAIRDLLTARQSAGTDSAGIDPARYVPIGDFERVTAELNRINQGVSAQAATAAVEQEIRQGHLPPFLRGWGIALCSVNKPAFDAFVSRTGPAVHRLFEPSGARMTLPDDGRNGLSDEDERVAAALGHAPNAMRASTGSDRP